MCRSNETKTTSKEETWSRGTNSRLPFDVNVVLNLSINSHVYASLRSMAVSPGARLSGEPSKTRAKRAGTKSEAARKMKTFQVAPAPISSRFLCPRPPLLFSALNRNRHATQTTFTPNGKREFVPLYQVFPLIVVYCLRYRSLSLYHAPTYLGLLFVLACRKSLFSLRDIKLGRHACDSSMRRVTKGHSAAFD